MNAIELSAGTIEYQDTGGAGPVLVLLHGLMMDASLWDGTIADLSADHRCIAPTLPLGAHRHAVRPGADLSLPAIARLIAEFLDRLDLPDVTLVGNDTGGALAQLLTALGVPPSRPTALRVLLRLPCPRSACRGYGRCAASRLTDPRGSSAPGHAVVQNLRRGHYELATDVPARDRTRTAFDPLAMAI